MEKMFTTEFRGMAEWMACKAALVNDERRRMQEAGEYGNIREYPFYSELRGMTQALKTLGIEYDFEYDEEVLFYRAVTVEGNRVEVKL